METKKIPKEGILFYLKCLLFSYIITGLLLMLLALLLYKFRLTEQVVSAGIILIYVAASFFSGFVTGKKRKEKKFLWGLLMGAIGTPLGTLWQTHLRTLGGVQPQRAFGVPSGVGVAGA